MANFKTHSLAGVATGLLTELLHILYQKNVEKRKLSSGEITGRLLFAGAGGFVGSTLPDIIDPAIGPNHRNIGHGIVTGIAGISTCTKLNKKTENPYAKAFIKGTATGTVSHLALDASTPKGIPTII